MSWSRSRVAAAGLVLACACGPWLSGCTDDADKPLRERPELTDDVIVRMMSAMRALREQAKAVLPTRAPLPENLAGREPHLAGVGLAGLVGETIALPILEKHGFVSVLDYESTVAYTQQALHCVLLGADGGLGGMGKSIRLEAELRELTDILDQLNRGGTPTLDSEPADAEVLRQRIAELKDQLESSAEAAAAMKSGSENIPRVSIDAVAKHREELVKLFSGS